MSYNATDWAMAMPVSPSAKKFLLVVLAYCADRDTATCHPSIAHLANTTAQDRKTVIANLRELEKEGLILDTGRRVGRTGQVKEYRLVIQEGPAKTAGEESQNRNSSNNGTVPFFRGKSTVFPRKEYQKRDTEQVSEQVIEQEIGDKPPVSSKAADPCPHQAIIDLYHQTLPTCRQVRIWNDARKAKLRARWKEDPKRQSLEWWGKFFGYIAESDFLTGKIFTPGHGPFELGLDWIVFPENFAKILEGKYENNQTSVRPAAPAPQEAIFRGCI